MHCLNGAKMLNNYNFAKLINNSTVEYAPLNLLIDGTWYCPATDAQIKNAGYKKVIDTPKPEETGKEYKSYWKELSKSIKKVWEVIPDTKTPSEKRQEAYMEELSCFYQGSYFTVDQMNALWSDYCAEGRLDIAQEIQPIIADAKARIREEYPDN